MNELLIVNNDNQTVSARELHEKLEVASRFSRWFETNKELFIEGTDYNKCTSSTVVNNGAVRELEDYNISILMAKHLAMMSRTPKGREIRDYLINVEKAWNTPEMVMARGLMASKKLIDQQSEVIKRLTMDTERMKPKEIFADAVATSDTSILIGELAKLLKQNGVDMGQNRLFKWLRDNKYLMKSNEPTQKAMELKLFEVMERTVNNPDGSVRITRTTKVTGKGQQYFINKFLGDYEYEERI